jgi:hypothetical protein
MRESTEPSSRAETMLPRPALDRIAVVLFESSSSNFSSRSRVPDGGVRRNSRMPSFELSFRHATSDGQVKKKPDQGVGLWGDLNPGGVQAGGYGLKAVWAGLVPL